MPSHLPISPSILRVTHCLLSTSPSLSQPPEGSERAHTQNNPPIRPPVSISSLASPIVLHHLLATVSCSRVSVSGGRSRDHLESRRRRTGREVRTEVIQKKDDDGATTSDRRLITTGYGKCFSEIIIPIFFNLNFFLPGLT